MLTAHPPGHPRMPEQQADVMPGSPLAIVALFTEVLRERFRPGNGLSWTWSENPTPSPEEENTPTAARKVVIEPAFNTRLEVRNARPAIFVDKGETLPGKVVLGHLAGQELHTGLRGFYTLATIPIEVEVVSDAKGESAILADITWFYLLAGREMIREAFGIHEFSPPVLGRTGIYEADKTLFSTRISFEIQIDLRWATKPISPVLKDIILRFRRSGETDPSKFLLSRYLTTTL